jgi:hypothetical protein
MSSLGRGRQQRTATLLVVRLLRWGELVRW